MANKIISVFDTSIANYNLGNGIIMEAVIENLYTLFPEDFFIRLPIEDIGRVARKYNSKAECTFVGGTNVLNCDIRKYRQWDLTIHNIMILRRLVLMGCGWWKYEDNPVSKFTKWALGKVLSRDVIHSVRDSYTLRKCQEEFGELGFRFINTGCPTLWGLTDEVIESIPKFKSNIAVVTITDYSPSPERDTKMVKQICKAYEKVYLFPQGTGDIIYLSRLGLLDELEVLPPRLSEFNSVLESGADYIGTRLHAGIRALQKSRRSTIIGIDNRSIEMNRDFGIPVISQANISSLSDEINKNYSIHLSLPWDNIEEWKNQFRE